MVFTKASAMPFDCGLRTGVRFGFKPIIAAELRVVLVVTASMPAAEKRRSLDQITDSASPRLLI